MTWNSIIENGTEVDTPFGKGTVKSQNQERGMVRVEVNGQLYETPISRVSQADNKQPANKYTIKTGDRVSLKSGSKGTVTDVTQRTVRVELDNGQGYKFAKSDVRDRLNREFDQPKEQPKDEKDEQPKEEQADKPKQSQEPKGSTEPKQDTAKTGDALYGLLELKKHLENKIDSSVDGELKELKEQVKQNQKLEIKIGDKTTVVEGLRHKQLEQLITYASLRLNPLLVGMAGTGKTHAGEQTAESLGLDFYTMSVGAQTSKSDIIGYMSATGNYVTTHFRKAYEEGGVFLMDEIDAGNSNVLIQINSALSNGLCAFPDRMVEKHDDFVFVASANTFGNGANRQYVGRNQLDAATLDRFAIIEWLIDDELEQHLTVGLNGKAWYKAVKACRDYVAEKNIRALVTPRATQKGSKLIDTGQDLKEVISATILVSVPEDKKQDVTDVATKVFNLNASEVKSQLPVSELVRS